MEPIKIDHNCIPYPRKGIYWLITLPYLLMLIGVTIYLWTYSIPVSIAYLFLYIMSTLIHGYICSFSECPYKGTLCPGAFGWFPVGKIAGKIKPQKRNDKLIGVLFLVIMLCILGILIIPLFWLYKLGILLSIGYFLFILLHFFSFVLFVCPKCAGRGYCPTAKLSNRLNKMLFNKEVLAN